jgi:hypothetical protein
MTLSIGAPRIRTLLLATMVLALPLLMAATAPAARGATLPLVWSGTLSSAGSAGFTSIATGPDNAVYAAGYAEKDNNSSASRLLLEKYVDAGATMSQAWMAMPPGDEMAAAKVAVDPSGNVIVAGTKGPFAFRGPSADIVVLKFSPAGALLWTATYDGPAHHLDYVKDLALDADGNALVVGSSAGGKTGRDYITVKVNADGALAWARRFAGSSDFDEARSVAVDPSGNVYVTGESRIQASKPGLSGPLRVVTISYSPAGARRWIVRSGLTRASGGSEVMYCGVQGSEGVVVAGWRYSGSPAFGHDFFAKYTLDGHQLWSRTLGAGTHSDEWPSAAALDGTGAPIAAGSRNRRGDMQAWLAGASATGGHEWHSSFSSLFTNPSWAEFGSVAAAADGRVLAAGETASGELADMDIPTTFLVRYSPGWPVTAPLDYVGAGSATTEDTCTAVAIGAAGMYAVGRQGSIGGDSDAVILKF